ncbi:MAG TPA: transposase [Aggregicoccus sp.]|nr:transposase [Aggregicoccus sp.]
MASASVCTGWGVLEEVRRAFSRPGFWRFCVLACGWVQVQGWHTVTRALMAAGVAGKRHHEAFHRFFSRGSWKPDVLGRLLLLALLRLLPAGAQLLFALDDTLCPKRGPHVFGIGSHRDAVLSSARHKVLRFGHVWVVLALVVRLPFAPQRAFALPVCLRLYRTKKECARARAPFRTKTQLAAEMLRQLAAWLGGRGRRVRIVMDGAYCCDTVLKPLPEGFVAFGAMRPDAALTAAPPARRAAHQRGRARTRGQRLPAPAQLAAHRADARCWKRCGAHLYGRTQRVQVQAFQAQWYRVTGARLLRVVVVRTGAGTRPFRTFFCTDAGLSAREVLETYALRWSLEVTFRELKQLLGFADSPARKRQSVLRTAPFVAFLYSLLVLGFARQARAGLRRALRLLPPRPWYGQKQGICFEDILRATRHGLQGVDVLRPALSKPLRQKNKPRPLPHSGLLLTASG